VEYLGHIVSHEGVKVDPNKIKATRECLIPKTLKKPRGFLGLIGYYCKFFKNYNQITTPLTTLLNKESFSWTEEETKSFEKLKETMCTTLVLATLDFTKTFVVGYDALGHVDGAFLMQEGRPLAFESIQIEENKTYSNPFMKKKRWPYYMQFRNGALT
jgi:hypothetical protein